MTQCVYLSAEDPASERAQELTISAVTKMLILTEVGTNSMMIEKVSQRFARANHEKMRLKRLY